MRKVVATIEPSSPAATIPNLPLSGDKVGGDANKSTDTTTTTDGHKRNSSSIRSSNVAHGKDTCTGIVCPSESPTLGMDCSSKKNAQQILPGDSLLLDVTQIDSYYQPAAYASVGLYLVLLLVAYASVPRDEWHYLDYEERRAAAVAVVCMAMILITLVVPIQLDTRDRPSGIVVAGVVTTTIALCTNCILAFLPTVVLIDPVTRARVYIVRWCEWVPLGGLATFMSEAVDMEQSNGLQISILFSMLQLLAILCGWILPLCPGVWTWRFVVTVAFILYASIFPRVLHKRRRMLQVSTESSSKEDFKAHENCKRIQFAYDLILNCSIVWTVLVIVYFVNMYLHRVYPTFIHPSLAMIFDTFFDVLAKALYNKLIIDIHQEVFHQERRIQRKLYELRQLMRVLWTTSTDAIVVTAWTSPRITALISPSFLCLLGTPLPGKDCVNQDGGDQNHPNRNATMLKVEVDEAFLQRCPHRYPSATSESSASGNRRAALDGTSVRALLIEYCELESDRDSDSHTVLAEWDVNTVVVREALEIIHRLWTCSRLDQSSALLHHTVHGPSRSCVTEDDMRCRGAISKHDDSSPLLSVSPSPSSLVDVGQPLKDNHVVGEGPMITKQWEIKANAHSTNARVAIIRDITQRHLILEAERRAHAETQARQRDAQAINRFTRHEVKNGLLASIELCSTLEANLRSIMQSDGQGRSRRILTDLDHRLKTMLGTILDETLAREIVHGEYRLQRGRVNVADCLRSTVPGLGSSPLYPLRIVARQGNIPDLHLDPHLLRYIYRNAVSNACKYGKPNGCVESSISYDEGMLRLLVRNEPGPMHDKLVSMSDEASDRIFTRGCRLHQGQATSSTGGAAWIVRQCAQLLDGTCTIQFRPEDTVFAFSCPAEALERTEEFNVQRFTVPSTTWGLAIDDSKVQRKLLHRILTFAGVHDSRCFVLGKDSSDVAEFKVLIRRLVTEHPDDQFLILVDENLDFHGGDLLSGSVLMESILQDLSPDEESRILALVRSANDSCAETALYSERTHGFFPKAPVTVDTVRGILAPLWMARFGQSSTTAKKMV